MDQISTEISIQQKSWEEIQDNDELKLRKILIIASDFKKYNKLNSEMKEYSKSLFNKEFPLPQFDILFKKPEKRKQWAV